MRILIVGGTGAIGSQVVNLLKGTVHEVVVTSRVQRESVQNISYIAGNAKSVPFLTAILNGKWDVIVDFMSYTTREFSERVTLFLNATGHYLFISSGRVYADSEVPIKESSKRLLDVSTDLTFLSTDEYSLAKARQEDILKESGKTNWTIIRPYISYSSQRLQLGVLEKENWLYRALKGRTIVFSEEINSKLTTMTYGLDVAKGIVSIMGNPQVSGEIFHITQAQSIRWSEVLAIYLNVLEQQLGARPKVVVDAPGKFYSYHPASYQIKYDRLYNRVFDTSKIANYVKVDEFTPCDHGLKICLEEFLKHPSFGYIDWRAEARKDRRTKEIASISEMPDFRKKAKYILYRFIIN